VDLLKKEEGAEIVLNSSEPDFLEKIKKLAKDMNASVVFEAVAGEMTGKYLSVIPDNGTVYVYGGLS